MRFWIRLGQSRGACFLGFFAATVNGNAVWCSRFRCRFINIHLFVRSIGKQISTSCLQFPEKILHNICQNMNKKGVRVYNPDTFFRRVHHSVRKIIPQVFKNCKSIYGLIYYFCKNYLILVSEISGFVKKRCRFKAYKPSKQPSFPVLNWKSSNLIITIFIYQNI